MQLVYLWFLQDIFDWVYEKILTPVFNFLKGLLSDLFTWLYNKVLYPLLENTILKFATWLWDKVKDAIFTVVYAIYSQLLSLVDTLYDLFDTLSGLSKVTRDGEEMSLLWALFSDGAINKLFWMVNFMGFTLAMLLAIYAVAQSAMDLDFENKRPVSRVLSSTLRCLMQLFLAQFMVFLIIELSQLMLEAINTAVMSMHGGTASSLGRIVFAVSSMAASRTASDNLPVRGATLSTGIRNNFYSGSWDYTDVSLVKQYFDVVKFDYIIGVCMSVFLLIILFSCLLVFCQRLFDMLMLYVASPLFVATIPLDDGEKFNKWREMFIGKTFSGFGLVFAMKLYIMICPIIMNSSLRFTESVEFDYVTKLVFLAGGALAVTKSGSMVTSILSEAAARNEGEMATMGAALGVKAVKTGGNVAWKATKTTAKYTGKALKGLGKGIMNGLGFRGGLSGSYKRLKMAAAYEMMEKSGREGGIYLGGSGGGMGGFGGGTGGFGGGMGGGSGAAGMDALNQLSKMAGGGAFGKGILGRMGFGLLGGALSTRLGQKAMQKLGLGRFVGGRRAQGGIPGLGGPGEIPGIGGPGGMQGFGGPGSMDTVGGFGGFDNGMGGAGFGGFGGMGTAGYGGFGYSVASFYGGVSRQRPHIAGSRMPGSLSQFRLGTMAANLGTAPSAGVKNYGAAPSAGVQNYGAAPSAGMQSYEAAPSAGMQNYGVPDAVDTSVPDMVDTSVPDTGTSPAAAKSTPVFYGSTSTSSRPNISNTVAAAKRSAPIIGNSSGISFTTSYGDSDHSAPPTGSYSASYAEPTVSTPVIELSYSEPAAESSYSEPATESSYGGPAAESTTSNTHSPTIEIDSEVQRKINRSMELRRQLAEKAKQAAAEGKSLPLNYTMMGPAARSYYLRRRLAEQAKKKGNQSEQ